MRLSLRLPACISLVIAACVGCTNIGLRDQLENPGGSEVFSTANYIFASSWISQGDMRGSPYSDCNAIAVGQNRADCACTRAAIANRLRRSSSHVFRAWLSLGTADAKCRIQATGVGCSTTYAENWLNTRNEVVAAGFNVFTLGALTNPVRYTESGLETSPDLAWTGTGATGTATSFLCNDWSANTNAIQGTVGNRLNVATTWTDSGSQMCDTAQRIYCIASPTF